VIREPITIHNKGFRPHFSHSNRDSDRDATYQETQGSRSRIKALGKSVQNFRQLNGLGLTPQLPPYYSFDPDSGAIADAYGNVFWESGEIYDALGDAYYVPGGSGSMAAWVSADTLNQTSPSTAASALLSTWSSFFSNISPGYLVAGVLALLLLW
jgi:hypothetical protein